MRNMLRLVKLNCQNKIAAWRHRLSLLCVSALSEIVLRWKKEEIVAFIPPVYFFALFTVLFFFFVRQCVLQFQR